MSNKVTIIKPKSSIWQIDFSEIWEFRELLQTLAWRDIKVRYKQTVIGIAWAIIQPFTQMIIFSFFFGKLAQIPSDGVPYPLFSYSGLILWNMFATALGSASNSMVGSAALISKVYFPRVIVPISSTLVTYIDYLISGSILLLLLAFYRYPLYPAIIFAPILALGALLLANGLGMFLAAINVQFRDIRYALPFFIQLMVFISPVIYPVSVAGQFAWIVNLNPMSGYLELHRALILGHQSLNLFAVGYSLLATLVISLLGLVYFNWQQRKFADII